MSTITPVTVPQTPFTQPPATENTQPAKPPTPTVQVPVSDSDGDNDGSGVNVTA